MTRLAVHQETVTTTHAVTTSTSTPFKVNNAKTLSVQAIVTVDTPSAKTFIAGEVETAVITFAQKSDTVAKDYVAIYDTTGAGWAIYADTTGTTVAPAGAIYTAIAAGKKAKANISTDTTAADVAARFVAAFNALTGFTAKVTLTDNSDGTVTYALATRATATDAVTKTGTDSGAGSMTIGTITQGVASTVDTTADTITMTAHGLTTGLKGQTSSAGTLPSGITTSTDYFVIVVDANTIQLADTLVHALAGTALDLTDQGTSNVTHTFTPTALTGASLTLQKSNNYDPIVGTGSWDAVAAATSITTTADLWISDVDPEFEWCRLSYTLTAGRLSASSYILVKGDL